MYTIGVIGTHSSGKSTIANALAGTMFSRVAISGGTTAITTHRGARCTVADFPPIKRVNMDHLDQLDIVIFVTNAAKMAKYAALIDTIRGLVAARNRLGHYQMFVVVAGKYDHDDPELDEIVAKTAHYRVCGLKLPTAAAAADNDWAAREYVKAGRFRGELSQHERGLMSLADAADVVANGRKCAAINYIASNFSGNLTHICDLLKRCSGDPAIYMSKIAAEVRAAGAGNICTQYICLRVCGEALGLSKLEYLAYLQDSHLKCVVYAAAGDRARLAKYLYATDGDCPIPDELACLVPSLRSSYFWKLSYSDILAEIGAATPADIIKSIADSALRAYFGLCFSDYGALLADIVAGDYKHLRKCVTDAGVDWRRFRRCLSVDYFTDGRRGAVHKVVCDAAL